MNRIRYAIYWLVCAKSIPIYWAFMAFEWCLWRAPEETWRHRLYFWMLPHAGLWGYRMGYDEFVGMLDRIASASESKEGGA